MKTLFYFTLIVFLSSLFGSCRTIIRPDDHEVVPIRVENQTGATGCANGIALKVGFILGGDNPRNGGIILNPQATGRVDLSVLDGEQVIIEVRREDNDELLTSSNIEIWTESRSALLEDEIRTISYCDGDEISFEFF